MSAPKISMGGADGQIILVDCGDPRGEEFQSNDQRPTASSPLSFLEIRCAKKP